MEDDHVNFVRAGVPAVDVIDLDNPTWHTAQDDLAHVSQKSLQIVGDVILAALPAIEQRLRDADCAHGLKTGLKPVPTALPDLRPYLSHVSISYRDT